MTLEEALWVCIFSILGSAIALRRNLKPIFKGKKLNQDSPNIRTLDAHTQLLTLKREYYELQRQAVRERGEAYHQGLNDRQHEIDSLVEERNKIIAATKKLVDVIERYAEAGNIQNYSKSKYNNLSEAVDKADEAISAYMKSEG